MKPYPRRHQIPHHHNPLKMRRRGRKGVLQEYRRPLCRPGVARPHPPKGGEKKKSKKKKNKREKVNLQEEQKGTVPEGYREALYEFPSLAPGARVGLGIHSFTFKVMRVWKGSPAHRLRVKTNWTLYKINHVQVTTIEGMYEELKLAQESGKPFAISFLIPEKARKGKWKARIQRAMSSTHSLFAGSSGSEDIQNLSMELLNM